MSESPMPKDDAAMADILASIRRIVSEEQARVAVTSATPPGPQGDVLDLTPDMRVHDDAPAPTKPVSAAPLPVTATEPHADMVPEMSAEARPRPSREAPAPPPDVAAAPTAEPPATGDAVESDSGGIAYDLSELPVDEAQIADIVRAVLRDELAGDLGKAISRKIRDISREEIARAFEEFAADS